MYRTLNSHAYAAYIVGHETRTQIMDGALEHQKLYDAILSNEKNGGSPSGNPPSGKCPS